MSHRRRTTLVACLALGASCTSGDSTPDRAASSPSRADSATVTAGGIPWFPDADLLLLVPAHSNDRALVIPADSTSPDPEEGPLQRPATLFRLDGSSISARLALSAGSEGCVDGALDPSPDRGWGVGFVGGALGPVVADSLEGIARSDSARLATIVFRLASTVPNAAGGRFAGLPFTLVDMWRVPVGDGRMAIVATTRRQINQEDSPLEERTLLVAELDSAASTTPTLAWSSRSTGPEETVEGSELLAALRSRSGALDLVFSHDFGDQTSYSIVERAGGRQWKLRWMSRRFSC
jgi:hypothetical protein